MQLKRIPNLTITESVESIDKPYTLCGDFINVLTNHDDDGNHSVAEEIKRRLAPAEASRKEMLKRLEFDPEYSHLYIYGDWWDLMYVAKAIESMYEEVNR